MLYLHIDSPQDVEFVDDQITNGSYRCYYLHKPTNALIVTVGGSMDDIRGKTVSTNVGQNTPHHGRLSTPEGIGRPRTKITLQNKVDEPAEKSLSTILETQPYAR